jgi:hypothetical protein
MSSNDRMAAIISVLEGWNGMPNESIARQIVRALDQRTLATKWEGKRTELLQNAEGYWIPLDDLLDQLNDLPGAPLTKGDLLARMKNMSPEYDFPTHFRQGDPEHQAACLHVYYREKQEGTEFSAIFEVIYDEVVGPAEWLERDERNAKWAANLLQTVRSGRDLNFTPTIGWEGDSPGRYSRYKGQLFRLQNIGLKQQALFRVNDVGEVGVPTEPHIFSKATEARDAIRRFAVKPPPKSKGKAMWLIEDEDFAKLKEINRKLFGDGTHLTTDQRRDLANLMQVVQERAYIPYIKAEK